MSDGLARAAAAPPGVISADGISHGVVAIRAALGLGEAEERAIREAGRRLAGCVEGWVDAFYMRLLTDPNAMMLLDDDARVIRLKRSLIAWFHELLSLPFSEDYERARQAIGSTHVRIGMPTHLMVTAMGGIRRDVLKSILEIYADDLGEAQAVAHVISLALDMELALMLTAYRREERAIARQQDRAVYAERAARRFSHLLRDRVDAALCYADLAKLDDGHRSERLQKLKDVLHSLSRFDQRMQVQAGHEGRSLEHVRLGELCARALDNVSLGFHTRVAFHVTPPDLEANLHVEPVELAVEELAQNAALHAPGSRIEVSIAKNDGAIVIEVTDEGRGWEPDVEEIKDIYSLGSGLGLSFCEIVAELHEGTIELFSAPSGGAGVRLKLRDAPESGDGR